MRWDLFAILMLLPWAATFGGSVLAARMQSGGPKRQGAMLGFAAGIMIAASIWSLILPAFDNAGKTPVGAAVVSLGFLLGCLGMLLLDKLVPHQHMDEASPEGRPSHMSRPKLLVLAVALHNIPEGMAVGILLAGFAAGGSGITFGSAMVLSVGIAVQNFPEGAIISMPLHAQGQGKGRSFLLGVLSGVVEPLAAALTVLAASAILPILPYLLSFAAGAMIYVVVEELIPEMSAGTHSNLGTLSFAMGFTLMMALDVAL